MLLNEKIGVIILFFCVVYSFNLNILAGYFIYRTSAYPAYQNVANTEGLGRLSDTCAN